MAMPIIRFHLKGAPEGVTKKIHIGDVELRVLELFKGSDAPRTARSLAWATFGDNLLTVVKVRPILDKLIELKLVAQGCLPEGECTNRTDSITYTITFDSLKVGSDKRN